MGLDSQESGGHSNRSQTPSLQVFVHNQKITVGSLQVQVVECTRLPVVENASEVFCTVNVGE